MENQTTKKCKHCQTDIPAQAKKCPQCQSDLRGWFRKHPILTALGIFIIFLAIAGKNTGDRVEQVREEAQKTVNETTSNQEKTNTKQAVENTKTIEKQYREVFTFSGNGAKKSEPFTIQGERFKIAYDCNGDPNSTLCQAFVYKVGSSFPQLVMNNAGPTKDETIIYDSGEFYIDANTMGNYTMTIYDYR